MIFVDSNIPMYLTGADHPNKEAAHRLVDRATAAQRLLVTDAEVFQEILHRYAAIRRHEAVAPAWEVLQTLADSVLPVTFEDVTRARELLTAYRLSARDALHVAVMEAAGIHEILSFDTGFDKVPTIRRVL